VKGTEEPAELAHGRDSSLAAAGLAPELGTRYREQKRSYLGIGLSCLSDEEIMAAIGEAVRSRSRLTVSFINPDYVRRGHQIPGLIAKMNSFDVMLPDGWGIVYGARWVGLPIPNRQSNDDLCQKLFAMSAASGFANFLFGCAEGIPEQAATSLTAAFPGLRIAGTLHGHWDVVRGHPGYYDAADLDMMAEKINASGADILHVSVPTPLQQNWVTEMAGRVNVPVIITAGSFLEHPAMGRMHWPGSWINKLRIGWLYRLVMEPRRLWRRYTIDLLSYGRMVVREKLAKREQAPR
jgi:N-acetylglucosaminyldiphosphoundecaprenol N-acetyl-beta-D-mannosaminyltransferase